MRRVLSARGVCSRCTLRVVAATEPASSPTTTITARIAATAFTAASEGGLQRCLFGEHFVQCQSIGDLLRGLRAVQCLLPWLLMNLNLWRGPAGETGTEQMASAERALDEKMACDPKAVHI